MRRVRALRVAAVQLNSTADPARNLAVADRLTRLAAKDGATLIVLPEKWTAIGSDAQLRARYGSHAGYVAAFTAATDSLVRQRLWDESLGADYVRSAQRSSVLQPQAGAPAR